MEINIYYLLAGLAVVYLAISIYNKRGTKNANREDLWKIIEERTSARRRTKIKENLIEFKTFMLEICQAIDSN